VGENFTSLNKMGMLSRYPDFFQLSLIEEFECFDENSAEKIQFKNQDWTKVFCRAK